MNIFHFIFFTRSFKNIILLYGIEAKSRSILLKHCIWPMPTRPQYTLALTKRNICKHFCYTYLFRKKKKLKYALKNIFIVFYYSTRKCIRLIQGK